MSVLERRVEKLEATVKPPQINDPILMFDFGGGNITASLKGKGYKKSMPDETVEMFQARIEEEQGRELFWIEIVPLRKAS